MLDLYALYRENKINYKDIKESLYFKNPTTEKVDISIIIPVRDRLEFVQPVYNHLLKAVEELSILNYKLSITFVEHSPVALHLKDCPASYIWIPCPEDAKFNKCLCFNIGVLSGPDADYYMFYDGDLLCFNDFILKVAGDISSFMQGFKNRRVVYADQVLTGKFLQGEFLDHTITAMHPNIRVGVPGAPGGCIITSKELFFHVGGYDAEFFHGYSVEDQLFFDKCSLFDPCKSLDNELIHLYHGEAHARTEDFHMQILKTFQGQHVDDKKTFIKFVSEEFNKNI